jgi:spore germination cell wall hydrolase CwlJ-like protein
MRAEAAYQYQQAQEKCLATMVYGEARGEVKTGQVAVAYTALNRAVNRSVCDVILAPKQYSIFNGNVELIAAAKSPDKNPDLKNEIDEESWKTAVEVARLVMNKEVTDPTKGSTHYLAPKVMKIKGYKYPKWSVQYKLVAVIDNHKFYKPYYPKKRKDA